MHDLDRTALRAGVIVCLTLVAPLQILANAVGGKGLTTGWAALVFLGTVLGFILGAGQAAWMQRRGTPLTHALVVAGGTFAVVQAVGVVLRLIRGDDVNWAKIVTTAGIALVAGVVGGLLGAWLTKQGVRPSQQRGA